MKSSQIHILSEIHFEHSTINNVFFSFIWSNAEPHSEPSHPEPEHVSKPEPESKSGMKSNLLIEIHIVH